MSKVQLIDQALFARVLDGAKSSERKRKNYNFHSNDQANPHRFLNVMCRKTYITPHRHKDPPKDEAFLILEGHVAFILFNDQGDLDEVHHLTGQSQAGPMGIDISAGLWHTLVVLSDTAICYEVKPGPYDQNSDKEFASWAPHEGARGCSEYLERLTQMVSA